MRMGKVRPKDIAITKALCRNAECFFRGIGEPHDIWHLSKAYLYGVMVGKRMERARRKRNKK